MGHGARTADVVHLVCRAGTVRNIFSKEGTMCVCKHKSIQLKKFLPPYVCQSGCVFLSLKAWHSLCSNNLELAAG